MKSEKFFESFHDSDALYPLALLLESLYNDNSFFYMEQHPVPQNVTTFQFRLIGDMTIKQFGFLIGGAIVAYICYKLPLPFFITWPLTVLAALTGFGFAFVPVEERPMDVWVLSFLKNVYSPTQFIWQRKMAVPEPPPTPTPQIKPATNLQASQTIQSLYAPPDAHVVTTQTVPPKRSSILSWIDSLFAKTAPGPADIARARLTAATPTPKVESQPEKPQTEADTKIVELTTQVTKLQKELEEKQITESRILELQKQLTDLLQQKQNMELEITNIRKQFSRQPPFAPAGFPPLKSTPAPSGITTSLPQKSPTVSVVSPDAAIRAGIPRLTTYPNVVTGIVKDYDKNLLPAVLVTVKDTEGVPLRALKTNKLGQFAASTQLPNGTYVVEVEDPRGRYVFDRAQITLNGAVMPAVELVARGKREIQREELAKQIFGNMT